MRNDATRKLARVVGVSRSQGSPRLPRRGTLTGSQQPSPQPPHPAGTESVARKAAGYAFKLGVRQVHEVMIVPRLACHTCRTFTIESQLLKIHVETECFVNSLEHVSRFVVFLELTALLLYLL